MCRVRRESPTRQASGGERARRPIRKTFVFPPGPSDLDDEVLALDVAEVAKAVSQDLIEWGGESGVRLEITDSPHRRWPLGVASERHNVG